MDLVKKRELHPNENRRKGSVRPRKECRSRRSTANDPRRSARCGCDAAALYVVPSQNQNRCDPNPAAEERRDTNDGRCACRFWLDENYDEAGAMQALWSIHSNRPARFYSRKDEYQSECLHEKACGPDDGARKKMCRDEC